MLAPSNLKQGWGCMTYRRSKLTINKRPTPDFHLPLSPTLSPDRTQLRADLYTNGAYVLHLDSDAVVFEDVTYAHMFHLGKPVLPFRRYGKNGGGEGKVHEAHGHKLAFTAWR